MQIINPSTGGAVNRTVLRATLLANYTGAFVAPMGIVWTAGDFTVGQPKRITTPVGFTKANITAGIYITHAAAAGFEAFNVVMNGDETAPAANRVAGLTVATSAADGQLSCSVSGIPVVAGDYFTLRYTFGSITPTAIQNYPMTALAVEFYN